MASYLWLAFVASLLKSVFAYDNTRNDNLVVYWGQDSANNQQTLSFYCGDDTIDAFPLAFLYVFFDKGGEPVIDFANTCNQYDNSVFPGTNLADCSFLASDIQTCQSKGKIVTISLGGATGLSTFANDTQAANFADTIWNLFLGGKSSIRPFGSAVLDGVDIDLEQGTGPHWIAFINQLRSHFTGASKKYYVTGAPQCPFPDAAMGTMLNGASFDAVYVQFYNNYCGVDSPSNFNFDTWNDWALNTSPNKNVKVYIGAAASTTAGDGYVDAATLAQIIQSTQAQYPKTFGGVMMWDASEAYTNNRYDKTAKAALTGGVVAPAPTTSKTTSKTTTSKTTSTTKSTTTKPATTTPKPSPTAGPKCSGVAAWSASTTYTAGDTAVYQSHLWTAQWWTYDDTPGGDAGVWVDNGSCTSSSRKEVPLSVKHEPARPTATQARHSRDFRA